MQNDNNIIDPSDVFLDDNGNPIDPKSILGDINDQFGGEPNSEGDDPNPGNDDLINPGDNDDGNNPDSLDNYANPVDYAMKWLGYETDEVDFGEGPVKIAELSPEQQTDVLLNQLQNVVQGYEGEIERLRTQGPELADPFQQQVFEYLRQNGDPKKLAEFILQNDPASLATSLPGDELVRRHLAETMGLEGDDLEAEINFLKDSNKLDAYADRIKKLYEQKGIDISGLNQEQQQALQSQEQNEIEDFQKQAIDIQNFASSVKDISGIPVSKEVSDFITSQLIPSNHREDSPFVKSIENPQKLYRLAFLDNYFEDIVDNIKQVYFEMGKQTVTPASQALSKEPIRVQSFRSSSKPSSPVIGRDGRIDLDKVLNAENTI